jgi:hypothetical protein
MRWRWFSGIFQRSAFQLSYLTFGAPDHLSPESDWSEGITLRPPGFGTTVPQTARFNQFRKWY